MSSQSKIWYLEEVNLKECFCPINGAEDRYNKQPKRSFKRGEFIYFSDDTADRVYFIHAGAVKIAGYTEDGNEMIKAVLHPGEIFGELAVFGQETRSDYAQAAEDTEVCILDKDDVVGMMRDVSGFQNYLNKIMGERVIYTQKRLESLLFKDAKTRVAEYVLEQARKNGRETADGAVVLRNYLTHQEIASYTGTSRQTVTTVLNQFRDDNLLDFDRKRITVKNLMGLQNEVA
ncbi:MAG: Crp/Fnr family transcriptional regulator [Bacteroidetes bacterium]|nr:Crp/Fnr family transcriptional regulator [Bacteroidota bacterium]MCB0842850.1 Crp/Fnr family transcriptional regulator [Bacteroidota bacterium]MCB0852212.1 Crp/Fnr family transcriptional regulator [Bacteroidota bacterium]